MIFDALTKDALGAMIWQIGAAMITAAAFAATLAVGLACYRLRLRRAAR